VRFTEVNSKMDTKKLRPLDYLLCTSYSWIAECIRIKEVGLWRCFDIAVATHIGAVVDVNGGLMIAEMMGNGLRLDPITDYQHGGILADRIIGVRRNKCYDNETVRFNRNYQIIKQAHECLKYDYAGILEFVFPKIKDKTKQFYCSELYQHYAIEDDGAISMRHKVNPKDTDDCTPYDFQLAENLGVIA
jgi:hypothetical protein